MQKSPVVESIGSCRGSIGASAAGHLDLAIRHIFGGQGAVASGGYLRMITRTQHPFGNMAVLSAADSPQTTEEAVAPLLALEFPTMVLYTSGVSEAVAQTLLDKGYGQSAMPAMAVDIERMGATALQSGYEWTRIGAGSDGCEWSEVLALGYGLPLPVARMFSPDALGADMAPDATMQFFGIRHDGRLVATSMLYLAGGLAGIYCVATLAEERGKGLGAHVTAEALRTAHRLGYRVGVLQSSDDGHNVYLGLGFADLGWVPMFIRIPA